MFGKIKDQLSKKIPSEKRPEASENGAPNQVPTTIDEARGNGLPPAYAPSDPVDLTVAFTTLKIPDYPSSFPTADHCLVHLKLLYAFHALKLDIGYTDGLFGLWDRMAEKVAEENKNEAISKLREKRWSLFLARAVERFEAWWVKGLCAKEDARRLTCSDMIQGEWNFAEFTARGRAQKWTVSMLPPLGRSKI